MRYARPWKHDLYHRSSGEVHYFLQCFTMRFSWNVLKHFDNCLKLEMHGLRECTFEIIARVYTEQNANALGNYIVLFTFDPIP